MIGGRIQRGRGGGDVWVGPLKRQEQHRAGEDRETQCRLVIVEQERAVEGNIIHHQQDRAEKDQFPSHNN